MEELPEITKGSHKVVIAVTLYLEWCELVIELLKRGAPVEIELKAPIKVEYVGGEQS
ncbi:unnamed protein product [marine sediment metagenome]|uniref:Uncharacterized protein n=1 Tax=marine sediment metagenome TaxID=412755 RepID=X1LYG1_9ZZZZ